MEVEVVVHHARAPLRHRADIHPARSPGLYVCRYACMHVCIASSAEPYAFIGP